MAQAVEFNFGMAEFGGHDIFKDDVETGGGAGQGEAAALEACADHGDCQVPQAKHVI